MGRPKHPVQLLRRQAQAVPLRAAFLEFLAALQQKFRIIALLRRQARLRFHTAGQRAGNDTGKQHNQKCHWVTGVVGLECKSRHREK